MKQNWFIPFGLLAAVAVAAVLLPAAKPAIKGGPINTGDVAWMLTATGLVLLMTPGLSFFYGGMVRVRNVISTMLQSFIAMGVISILWIVVGFSLAFGDSVGGLFGHPLTFFMFSRVGGATHPDLSPTIPLVLFALFQLKFAIITPALITGSFAERVRFSGYLLFICLFSLFIYSPLAHWTWHPNGFLHKMNVLDFAGGTVVHMSAGFAALAGALVLGRRKVHIASEPHVPANIPFVVLGTGMLWFGWFGFNAGSALAASETAVMAFATTNTASAAAMLSWIFFDAMRGLKPSALGACIGAVVGLVAVTPAAGYITVGHSILIGVAASVVCNCVARWKSKSTLDDTLDVFPCHGVGGMVGTIATGIFAHEVGLIYGTHKVFLNHLLAIVIVGAYTFFGSYLLYKITDKIIPLRVSEEQEELGLDISQHGESVEQPSQLAQEPSNGIKPRMPAETA
ncbi:MAG: ammonium transporter [Acidobacteria bacterium]|nr:ammonium transporter [Acidobacteriota bacterium]MBI3655473.1 ammonium transporter [Acidobacteriota bacterium]